MEKVKPLAEYDIKNNQVTITEKCVWVALLDKRYKCEVHRNKSDIKYNSGILYVFDSTQDDNLVFESPVTLSYGAAFGPDGGDIDEWMSICCDAVDNLGR